MHFLYAFLNILFPPKCVLCGCLLKKAETDLCHACRIEAPWFGNVKRTPQFLDSFTAVWYYEKSVRKSLLHFKFYGRRQYAKSYGRLLAMELLKSHPEGFDLLSFIPVSRVRKLGRGYDQVQLIAQAVAAELGMETAATLKKIRHNPSQSGIQGTARRRANVLGVYRCLSAEAVRGKRILLLDDILTTGATASEGARTLKTAGAKEVHGAAVAASRKE